jgi:hypothetical protein
VYGKLPVPDVHLLLLGSSVTRVALTQWAEACGVARTAVPPWSDVATHAVEMEVEREACKPQPYGYAPPLKPSAPASLSSPLASSKPLPLSYPHGHLVPPAPATISDDVFSAAPDDRMLSLFSKRGVSFGGKKATEAAAAANQALAQLSSSKPEPYIPGKGIIIELLRELYAEPYPLSLAGATNPRASFHNLGAALVGGAPHPPHLTPRRGPPGVYQRRLHTWLTELLETSDVPQCRKYLSDEALEVLGQVRECGSPVR